MIFRSFRAVPGRRTSPAWKLYAVTLAPKGEDKTITVTIQAKSREGARRVARQQFGRRINIHQVTLA